MSVILVVLAFTISALLTRVLCNPSSRLYMLDHPTQRSLHSSPTPRGGGLAVSAAILMMALVAAGLYGGSSHLIWPGTAALMIAGISFLDDRLTISLGYRIVIHFVGAGLMVWGGFALSSIGLADTVWVLSKPLAIGLTLLFIVWMVNLYNFMDGMDGFAAGMALIGFGTFASLGWLNGAQLFMTLNLIVAAAAGGFLLFNFPPARIFMGDTGSSLFGFLAAAFILWADLDGIFPLWIGVLVFSPFIVDATATLLKRTLRGEKVWEAHKTHYYQRLVQLGWGHRRTVLWEYCLMLLCALSAVAAQYASAATQWAIVIAWFLVFVLLMLVVHRLEVRHGIVVAR